MASQAELALLFYLSYLIYLQTAVTEADRSHVPIRLRVMAINPAKRFYEQLDFIVTESVPDFFLMEKVP